MTIDSAHNAIFVYLLILAAYSMLRPLFGRTRDAETHDQHPSNTTTPPKTGDKSP